MIDLDNGRVIDVIDSRDRDDVVAWLSQFTNLKYVSRGDCSSTYASAIRDTHPNVHQISDRFHLVKNLTDAVTLCIYKILSGRVAIPLTKEKGMMNQLLGNKPSRCDKILLVKSLASQRRTLQEIRSLTGCSIKTIRKYIKMDEENIPKSSNDKRGQEHREVIEKTMAKVEKVRALHDKGYSVRQITDKTGHTTKTIKNYLSPNFNPIHGRYGEQRPGKLSPFRKEVISMRSKGVLYKDIHKSIAMKGYTGSQAAIRQFIAKEKRLQKDVEDYDAADSSEIIERKWLLKLNNSLTNK